MKTAKAILIAGAVIALPVAGYAFYQNVKNKYDIEFQGIQVTSIDESSIRLDVQFLISNSTGMKITVNNSAFTLWANGQVIGIASQTVPLQVPTMMMASMSASIVISKTAVETAAFNILFSKITGKATGMHFDIQGTVKIQINEFFISLFPVSIPITQTYDL